MSVPGNRSHSFQQLQYHPISSCMLVADSAGFISIYDLHATNFARRDKVTPNDYNNAPRPSRVPSLAKGIWHSDHTSIWASYSHGECALYDMRAATTAPILNAFFHNKNSSAKPVTVLPLMARPFFVTSGHYSGGLELKLWDLRRPNEPIGHTINLGSTSSPVCMVADEDTRRLYASARSDHKLRYFSLYRSDEHFAPSLELGGSYVSRTGIRHLAMVPKGQWQHHRCEVSQLLLSNGSLVETLHVLDQNEAQLASQKDALIPSPNLSPRNFYSYQDARLPIFSSYLMNSSASATTTAQITGSTQLSDHHSSTATFSNTSAFDIGAQPFSHAYEEIPLYFGEAPEVRRPASQSPMQHPNYQPQLLPSTMVNEDADYAQASQRYCSHCGVSLRPRAQSSADSTPITASGPHYFTGMPYQFENRVLLSCESLLDPSVPVPDRLRVPITPWGALSQDLATQFLQPEFSDLTLDISPGTKYPVHKCLLAARSPYFRMAISGLGYNQDSLTYPNIVNGIEIELKVFERVLFYIYTDTLPVDLLTDHLTTNSTDGHGESSINDHNNNSDNPDLIYQQLQALSIAWQLEQLSTWLLKSRNDPHPVIYQSHFLQHLNLLKTQPDQYYCDLTLIPGQPALHNGVQHTCERCKFNLDLNPFKVPKLFAVTRNEFLKRILQSGMEESRSGQIHLNLLSAPALAVLVSYLLSPVLECDDTNVLMELWTAGDAYFMPEITAACELAIRPLINTDNCSALYDRAGKSLTYMRTYLANFMAKHFSTLEPSVKEALDPELKSDLDSVAPVKSSANIMKFK